MLVLIVRVPSAGATDQEALRFRTREGIGIGTEETEVLRLLGRPRSIWEWTERQGPVVSYNYPGLHVRIARADRKVLGIGVSIEDGYFACEHSVLARIMATSARFPRVFGDLRLVPRERFGDLRLGEVKRDEFVARVGLPCGPPCDAYHSSIARQWHPRNLGVLDSWRHIGIVAGFCSSNDRLYGVFGRWSEDAPDAEVLKFAVSHMTTPEGLMIAVHRLPRFIQTYGNPVKVITPAIWTAPWIIFSNGLVVGKNSADDGLSKMGTYDERVCG